MTILPRGIISLQIVAIILAQTRPSDVRLSSAHIVVMDTLGYSLRQFKVTIQSAARPREPGITITRNGVLTLPYGNYIVTATASLHRRIERNITVKDNKTLIVLPLIFDDQSTSLVVSPPLYGRVRGNTDQNGTLWIKLIGVLGTVNQEELIGSDGQFEFKSVPYGEYFALIFRDGKLLLTHQFKRDPAFEGLNLALGEER